MLPADVLFLGWLRYSSRGLGPRVAHAGEIIDVSLVVLHHQQQQQQQTPLCLCFSLHLSCCRRRRRRSRSRII
jgi:hypothetical protein